MVEISVYRGEVKPIQLTITDQNKRAVDLSSATLFLSVKRYQDDEDLVFYKDHADFDLSLASLGIVSVNLTQIDTNQASGRLVGQIRAIIATSKLFSDEFYLNIQASVIPGLSIGSGAGAISGIAGNGS